MKEIKRKTEENPAESEGKNRKEKVEEVLNVEWKVSEKRQQEEDRRRLVHMKNDKEWKFKLTKIVTWHLH